MFSGSYDTKDVIFLLKNINMPSTSVEDKEQLIQKKDSHYSELITHEKAPKLEYMNLFYDLLKINELRFSHHVYQLSHKIHNEKKGQEIVIVSLARAGTPVGVLVKNILEMYFNRKVAHYSVSIIRDRGLDLNAIKYITKEHNDIDIVFIDGWTGKGVIGQELKQSIIGFNNSSGLNVDHCLYVVADISGTAQYSATHEDYLLPSAILNSTISGLVSRTILNEDYINENDFHGAIYYEHLQEYDISKWFINSVLTTIEKNIEVIVSEAIKSEYVKRNNITNDKKKNLCENSINTIQMFLEKYNLSNRNFIKPGVGESTRVLLRRIPKELWVKNKSNEVVQHLLFLAESKNIKVIEDSSLFYNAVAIIEELD